MKRSKIAPHPAPACPANPAATANSKAETAATAAGRQTDPQGPEQAGTEEAVAAWRNEGDPN